MSVDPETVNVYGAQADEYAAQNRDDSTDPNLAAFVAGIAPGGRVLDLGCGPGIAAARMADAGLLVDATDATPEMVRLSAAHPVVTAWVASFDEITGSDIYDGIWANFSLLHAPRTALPAHLGAIRRALRPGGLFHIAMKTGTGARRDALGRLYTYYGIEELQDLLRAADLTPFEHATGASVGLDGTLADWVVIRAHG